MDGWRHVGAFLRVSLTLAVPGLIAAGILAFIFSWNEFSIALNLTISDTATVPVGIAPFAQQYEMRHGDGRRLVLATAPALILMFVGQRFIVKGLTLGSLKQHPILAGPATIPPRWGGSCPDHRHALDADLEPGLRGIAEQIETLVRPPEQSRRQPGAAARPFSSCATSTFSGLAPLLDFRLAVEDQLISVLGSELLRFSDELSTLGDQRPVFGEQFGSSLPSSLSLFLHQSAPRFGARFS